MSSELTATVQVPQLQDRWIYRQEREREKKSRAREHSCDRKKAMEFFMKNFDKKKYLKLLPKNEFRKPTKMPLSK